MPLSVSASIAKISVSDEILAGISAEITFDRLLVPVQCNLPYSCPDIVTRSSLSNNISPFLIPLVAEQAHSFVLLPLDILFWSGRQCPAGRWGPWGNPGWTIRRASRRRARQTRSGRWWPKSCRGRPARRPWTSSSRGGRQGQTQRTSDTCGQRRRERLIGERNWAPSQKNHRFQREGEIQTSLM